MSHRRLYYHVVTATKRRAPLISAEVEAILFGAFEVKARAQGGKVIAVGGVEDHVHLVVAIPATIAVADSVRTLKASASRAVNDASAPDEGFQWQDGYAIFTLNPNDLGGIVRYVQRQKEHHAGRSLWAPYEACP